MHAAHPGTKFIAAGQKNYAVYSSNGPTGDISVTFSSRNFDCDGDGTNKWRGPTGFNVPSYISSPTCGRFYVDSSTSGPLTYGTATTPPAWMYPLDGNRFAPGFDPAHRGGDVWTADAGMAMMEHEPWSGMLLTLGSIDKASHVWGGITDDGTYPAGSPEEQAHLRFIAKTADEQVGRLIAKRGISISLARRSSCSPPTTPASRPLTSTASTRPAAATSTGTTARRRTARSWRRRRRSSR